jgi:hypothetical protein
MHDVIYEAKIALCNINNTYFATKSQYDPLKHKPIRAQFSKRPLKQNVFNKKRVCGHRAKHEILSTFQN